MTFSKEGEVKKGMKAGDLTYPNQKTENNNFHLNLSPPCKFI